MQLGLIRVPKATLYESIAVRNGRAHGQNVSDELLSGWLVCVRQKYRDYLSVTTHYGYRGWLAAAAVRIVSGREASLWDLSPFFTFPGSPAPIPIPFGQDDGLARSRSRPGESLAAMISHGSIDVQTKPRVQSVRMASLYMGSSVIPCGAPEGGWQKIRTADRAVGYVPAVSLLRPPKIPPSQEARRAAILSRAQAFLGTQYRWGGKTRDGIDCSGLAFMSYYMCGVLLYRDAIIKEGFPVREIPFSRIRPADLLYFPGHVALYLGNGQYVHATGNLRSFCCTINSLRPGDDAYRKDLADSITAVGSAFPPG